jgi:hypothetical protein
MYKKILVLLLGINSLIQTLFDTIPSPQFYFHVECSLISLIGLVILTYLDDLFRENKNCNCLDK